MKVCLNCKFSGNKAELAAHYRFGCDEKLSFGDRLERYVDRIVQYPGESDGHSIIRFVAGGLSTLVGLFLVIVFGLSLIIHLIIDVAVRDETFDWVFLPVLSGCLLLTAAGLFILHLRPHTHEWKALTSAWLNRPIYRCKGCNARPAEGEYVG